MTWQVSLQESLTKEPLEDIIDEDGVIGLIEREKNNEQKFKWWQVFDIKEGRGYHDKAFSGWMYTTWMWLGS